MASKIDIELQYCPNRCILLDIELHSAKIHKRNVILVTPEGCLVSFWNVRAEHIISKFEFERADIEPIMLTSCSTNLVNH